MFDIMGDLFSAFEKLVKNWTTVQNKSDNDPQHHNEYLFLTLNASFYDFLIEVNRADIFPEVWSKETIANLTAIVKKYNPPYLKESLKEFVLIPRNEFNEILEDYKDRHKMLDEVLNKEDYLDYPIDE